MKKFLKDNWALLLIVAVATFFRFWQINRYPGGLFPDEAANGLDINTMFHGRIQPFYPRSNGREGLFFYFEALSVLLFGRGVWQFKIVVATFGVAEVLAAYFLAKRLFGKKIALLAAFFMAASAYPIAVEHAAFRANTVPLFTTLTLLFLVRYFQETDLKKKKWSIILSGLFFGLGFYTYPNFKMMVPLLGGFALVLLYAHRAKAREIFSQYRKPVIIFCLAFLVAFAWIGTYFIKDPGAFVGRAGQVSVFNKTLNKGDLPGTIIMVAKKTILSFFSAGDLNWRQNVSGAPFLAPFISPFFAGALILFTLEIFVLLWKAYKQQQIDSQIVFKALIATWFWFMLAPELITAEGIPHGLRLIGVMPGIFIMSAWSVNWVWEHLTKGKVLWPQKYFAVVFLVLFALYNFYLYYVVAVSNPYYYYAFRADLTTASNYLNHRNLKDKTYLSLDIYSVQTTDYLTTDHDQPYHLINPADSDKVNLKTGDQIVFTMSTLFDTLKFCQAHPSAQLIYAPKNEYGLIDMAVYSNGNDTSKCQPMVNSGFNTNPSS